MPISHQAGLGLLYTCVLLVLLILAAINPFFHKVLLPNLFVNLVLAVTAFLVVSAWMQRCNSRKLDRELSEHIDPRPLEYSDPRIPQPRAVSNVPLGGEVQVDIEAPAATEPPTSAITTPANASSPTRLVHLDNLKTILTAVVVVHHVTCAFAGVSWYYMIGGAASPFRTYLGIPLLYFNESYFMVLFFFISGYFTPSSLERKGTRAFLYDKALRLGLPFALYTLILEPALYLLIDGVLVDGALEMPESGSGEPAGTVTGTARTLAYSPGPGPCWFVGWLLLFNLAYASLHTAADVRPGARPGAAKLIGAVLGLGLLQLLVVRFIPDNFATMPTSIGSLPFDIAAFAAGILASRRGWLDATIPRHARVVAGVLSPLVWVGTVWAFFSAPPAGPALAAWILGQLGYYAVLTAAFCVAMCIAMLEASAKWLSFTSRATRFFSRAAYAVYVIHPLVVVPLTYAWVVVLRAAYGVDVRFPEQRGASDTPVPAELLLLGWGVVSVSSLLIVWPLAALVRRLPGLRHLL